METKKEKLKFKLQLWATFWDKPPRVKISISDLGKGDSLPENGFEYNSNKPALFEHYFEDSITHKEDEPITIEFEHTMVEGNTYSLVIDRYNKGSNQTKIDSEGNITHDQLLHIKSIEIDEIDIGALVYEGVYYPDYPEPWATQQKQQGNALPGSFKNVTAMGHNGKWQLTFKSPFYMWLLENLY
jgi:hypothetical protein